jgi:hypothetical protein
MMQSMDVKRSVMGYVEAIREELGDYQLYRLPLPTDLNARQTKQVVFLVKPRVKIERFYRFDYDVRWDRSPELSTPESMIAFENRKATGLGEPLPAGQVRVFDAHGDREFFIGEASMSDKPVNLPVELGVSKAMDLGLEIDAAGLDIEELQGLKLRDRADVEVRAFNGKRVPVTLEFRQPVEDNSVTSNSTDLFRRKDGNLVWRLQVPANGTHVLNYRVEWPMIVIDPSH